LAPSVMYKIARCCFIHSGRVWCFTFKLCVVGAKDVEWTTHWQSTTANGFTETNQSRTECQTWCMEMALARLSTVWKRR